MTAESAIMTQNPIKHWLLTTRKASPSSTLLTCLCPFYSAINKYCPVRQMVCGWQFGTQGPD
jgi:hypothetical protein